MTLADILKLLNPVSTVKAESAPVPVATAPPSSYGLTSYAPMSSTSNPTAANYVNTAPMSVPGSSTQLNAYGAPLYSNNAWNTNNQVAKTNTLTGALLPTATPAPASTTPPTGSNDNGQAIAQASLDANIAKIQDLFNTQKQAAADELSSGQTRLNDILSAINDYKNEAQTNFTNSGQQITNQASDILHGNAVNAKDLVGKAVGSARSLGLGLSSRINLGQGLMQNLESTQGNTMAKAGEQNAANQANLTANQNTAKQNEDTAQANFQDVQNEVNRLNNANVAGYGTNLDQATTDFAGMLNNIVNYNRSLTALTLPGSPTAANPDMSGIENTLATVLGGLPSTTTANSGANTPTNLAQPTSLLDLLKKQGLYNGQ
jgi:hypothetical protein